MTKKPKQLRRKAAFTGRGTWEPSFIHFPGSREVSRTLKNPEAAHAELSKSIQAEGMDLVARLRETDDQDLLPSITVRLLSARYAECLSLRDLVMIRQYVQNLESAVGEDTLTQVPNRRQYNSFMAGRFSGIERKRKKGEHVQPFAMAVIDIDHFKAVNTTGGHPGGDIVLQELTRIVQSELRRGSDTMFRYGGEEFVVTMPNTSASVARSVMEDVRQTIAEQLLPATIARMQPGPQRDALEALGQITASIGVSELSDHHHSGDELFSEADSALYAVKKGIDMPDIPPRNRVAVFTPDLAGGHSLEPSGGSSSKKVQVDLGTILAADTSDPAALATPEEIFERFQHRLGRLASLHGTVASGQARRVYPVDPIKGLQFVFSQPDIRKAILATDEDRLNIQRIDVALRHFEKSLSIDPLTRLQNRRTYDRSLKRELSESARDMQPRGLIIFDIDKFKAINDQYGHAVGDIVLYTFGKALGEIVRDGENIARIGGEEFGMIVAVKDVHELAAVAERIRARIEELVFVRVSEFLANYSVAVKFDRSAFTVSMGLAMSSLVEKTVVIDEDHSRITTVPTSAKELYAQADAALYVAKGDGIDLPLESWQTKDPQSTGRNRWVAYDPRMNGIKKTTT